MWLVKAMPMKAESWVRKPCALTSCSSIGAARGCADRQFPSCGCVGTGMTVAGAPSPSISGTPRRAAVWRRSRGIAGGSAPWPSRPPARVSVER